MMNRQRLTEVGIDGLSTANYATFMNQIKARADLVIATFPNLASDLLAPEVIAGQTDGPQPAVWRWQRQQRRRRGR